MKKHSTLEIETVYFENFGIICCSSTIKTSKNQENLMSCDDLNDM